MLNRCYKLLSLSILASLSPFSHSAFAQDLSHNTSDNHQENAYETLIVTGTRSQARTQFDTMSPMDVFSSDEMDDTASSELVDILTTLAPSFNVQRLPMNDGLVFVRPATLRGLSPDHTMVLINGKRRHRSALLGSNGAQGADLAQIPAAAIKRIEVLRDGAAAQYGSDAIAGVINIILDNTIGVEGYTQAGQYFGGDGLEWQTALRAGMKLGGDGHLSATLEYTDAEMTSRSRQRGDAIDFERQTGIKVKDPVQNWGQPERSALRLALNAEAYIGATRWYGFSTYGESEGVSDFNWRNPLSTSAYKPSPDNYPDYDLHKLYPAGFSPKFGQDDQDFAFTTGFDGDITADFSWDASMSMGSSRIGYMLDESINASLGTDSPTSFYLGELKQREVNANLDFVYQWKNSLFAYPTNVAFGLETREETYQVSAGDYASYAVGLAAQEGLPSGSNGFPGYSPQQAGKYKQRSYAGYVDVEMPINEQFTTGVALRYEDFSEFGDTLDGKVSMRYELSYDLALRGTVSTGFRAPTPGQLESTRTSQGLDTMTLNLFTSGRLAPTSPVAQYFGAQPLQAEESTSYTLGMTMRTDNGFNGSIDVYQIDVDNRFGQSQRYNVTDEIRQELLSQGVASAESFTSVNFYTNAFDTRTRGIDVAGNYTFTTSYGDIRVAGAVNYNDTQVTKQDGTIGDSGVVRIEDGLPKFNGNLSASWQRNSLEYFARLRYYGKWTDSADQASGQLYQDFGSEMLMDISATWHYSDALKARLGIENLFNSYPDEATLQASRGLIYSRHAPYDTDGGQYYIRFDYKF